MGGPTGQGFPQVGVEEKMSGAGEDEAARYPGFVHGTLDSQKKLGHPLHFVQDELIAPVEEGLWIGFRLEAKVQVIQAKVDVPLQARRVAHQGAFAYLPGAHNGHHGEDP